MGKDNQLIALGEKIWLHRKQHGFSKKLPPELRSEIVKIVNEGKTSYSVSRVLGISKNTIADWVKSQEPSAVPTFNELQVVESSPSPSPKPGFEVKLTGEVQGCKVEITGNDFSLLQRLFQKLSL
jgi:hypothetical protein